MKFNFRKIASALASTAMVGSTVALAAAATFPEPFVKNGAADVVYVYGSTVDLAALPEITSALSEAVQTDDAVVGEPIEGDFIELNKDSNKFNLGDNFQSVYTKLDSGELSHILADGTYTNDQSNDFDYTQEIALSAGETLAHFQDDDYSDEPAVGLVLSEGDYVANYTLDFDDPAEGGVAFVDFEDTDFPFLGREYYVLDVTNASGVPKFTLLDSANSATLQQGESGTVAGHSVTVEFISESNVIFNVDGVQIDDLQQGDSRKIPGTETYIAVKSILYTGRESDQPRVDFSIGTGKIILENSEEVQLNDDSIDNLITYISNSGDELNSIVLEWSAEEDVWLAPGEEVILPGFESLKILMSEFYTNEDTTEKFGLEPSGSDDIKISNFPFEDGTASFVALHANATAYTLVGEDTDKVLVTSNDTFFTFDTDTDKWVAVTWISGEEHESYLLEVTGISDSSPARNTTTLKSYGSGSSKTVDIDDVVSFGSIDLTMTAARDDDNSATFSVTVPSGAAYLDRIVSKEGIQIYLPVDTSAVLYTGPGAINFSTAQTTHTFNMTEEDRDDNIAEGGSFTAVAGLNSGETSVTTVTGTPFSGGQLFETADGSDKYSGYLNSDLATMVVHDTGGDQDDLDITYHGTEAYGKVFVSEADIITSGGSSGSEINIVEVLDSEFAAHEMRTKNAIVIGGSCVNSVAASLLGVSESTCGADWTTATGTSAGQAIIETFDHPYADGKVATLVAGWAQGDTVNAATALATQVIDITAGKKYTVGSDSVAVAAVA